MSLALLGNTPSITIGGVTIPYSQALIFQAYGGASGDYDTLRRGGTAYQVPVGKKLQILAIRIVAGSAAISSVDLGYGDAIVTGAAGAPAGNVTFTMGGDSATAGGVTTAAVGSVLESAVFCEVPAGKYPYSRNGNTPIQILLGRLVNA